MIKIEGKKQMTKLTVSGLTISLLKDSNGAITPSDFVASMTKQFPAVSQYNAALYWQQSSRRLPLGLPKVKFPEEFRNAPGAPTQTKEPKAPKEPKVKAVKQKVANKLTDKIVKAVKQDIAPKSQDEIDRIKAANLARLKTMTAKYAPGKVSASARRQADPDFDESKAQDEVTNIVLELDEYEAPAFLRRDQLKIMV
jgi:hypothetical protein